MPQNKSDDLSDEEDDRLSDEDRDDGKIDEDDEKKRWKLKSKNYKLLTFFNKGVVEEIH